MDQCVSNTIFFLRHNYFSLNLLIKFTSDLFSFFVSTTLFLSGLLSGVSILAQGSDLRGHGVLVVSPTPDGSSLQSESMQTNKAWGLFN